MHPARALLFLTVLFVTTALALTPRPLIGAEAGGDKLLHLAAFAVLTWLALVSWRRDGTHQRLVTGVFLLLWGGLIELVQLAVPGRSAEFADWLADALGVAAAGAAWRLIDARRRRARA